MIKTRLKFYNVSEIVGVMDIGLLVLTDEAMTRQLSITCDKNMVKAFSLRMNHAPGVERLLPEALGRLLRQEGHHFEIHIHSIVDGIYKTLLIDTDTLETVDIRVSDAVLFAQTNNFPIYIEEELMSNQSTPFDAEQPNRLSLPINALSNKMLKMALEKSINIEDYKMAEYLNEELKRRKNKTE